MSVKQIFPVKPLNGEPAARQNRPFLRTALLVTIGVFAAGGAVYSQSSADTTKQEPPTETVSGKARPIRVEPNSNGALILKDYWYSDGTSAAGANVRPPYEGYNSQRIVSDYIILDYDDKVAVFRPNTLNTKESVVFKKEGMACSVEPDPKNPARLIVTVGSHKAIVGHDRRGRLEIISESQPGMGTVLE